LIRCVSTDILARTVLRLTDRRLAWWDLAVSKAPTNVDHRNFGSSLFGLSSRHSTLDPTQSDLPATVRLGMRGFAAYLH
jgi:hypothetical protein